eukprot:scaffold6939_cov42-Prasinocladus_malaysianus.AAC.1
MAVPTTLPGAAWQPAFAPAAAYSSPSTRRPPSEPCGNPPIRKARLRPGRHFASGHRHQRLARQVAESEAGETTGHEAFAVPGALPIVGNLFQVQS